MKKIFLMTALSLAMFGVMNAQTAATTQTENSATKPLPQVRAKAMVSKINNAVYLQGEQIGKVNDLYIGYYTQLDATNGDAAKIEALNKSTNAKLLTILRADQAKTWTATNK